MSGNKEAVQLYVLDRQNIRDLQGIVGSTACTWDSPGQASDASSSDDMDTDMEQNTLPFGNLASVLDTDNQDDNTAQTPFFEDTQEASSKFPSQQKRRRTMSSPVHCQMFHCLLLLCQISKMIL